MNGPQLCEIQVEVKWNNKSQMRRLFEIQTVVSDSDLYLIYDIYNTYCQCVSRCTAIQSNQSQAYDQISKGSRAGWKVRPADRSHAFFIWLKNIWSRLCNHYANVHGKQSVISAELSVHAGSVFTNSDTQDNISFKKRWKRDSFGTKYIGILDICATVHKHSVKCVNN